jgi:hypothetical protein
MARRFGRARMVRKFGTGDRSTSVAAALVAVALVAVGIPGRADAVGIGSPVSAFSSGGVGGFTRAAADRPAVPGVEVVDKRSRFSASLGIDVVSVTVKWPSPAGAAGGA